MMNHPHHRLSPSGRNFPGSLLANSQVRQGQAQNHRRSPTAPDMPTTSGMLGPGSAAAAGRAGRTWAAGDDDYGTESEREREKDRGREYRERERDMENMRDREKSRERDRDVGRSAQPRQQNARPTSAPAPPLVNPPLAPTAVASRQLFVRF